MAYTGITNKSITDYIGIVKIDDTEYLTGSTLFGVCDTVASAQNKIVKIEDFQNFTPTHGLTIHVLFLHTNESNKPNQSYTAENPCLQIGSNGTAYPIYQYKGAVAGYTQSTSWRDGAIVPLTFIDARYDDDSGTAEGSNYWIMNSSIDTGADGLASVDLNNVQYADDLKLIEALTGSGYLKRDSTTSPESWSLDDKTFSEVGHKHLLTDITPVGISSVSGLNRNGSAILYSKQGAKYFNNTGNVDFIGLQLSMPNNNDNFQLAAQFAANSNSLIFRQNDSGTWTSWQQMVHSTYSNGSSAVGSAGAVASGNTAAVAAQPIYVTANGTATPIAFTIAANVPADAVFTDTTYTSETASQNGTTVSLVTTGEKYTWNNKQDTITFNTTYNASTNKAATMSDVTSAINDLDGGTITGSGGNTKTITAISQLNGNISATFSDIAFPIKTIAGLGLNGTNNDDDITAEALITALGLSSAMHYIGGVDNIPPNSGEYHSGDVVTLNSTIKEYVFDGTNWRELGTEGSYKVVQSVVTDPSVSNDETSTSFISNITQDAGGVIAPIKKNLPIAAAGTQGIVSIATNDTNILSITDGVLSHKTGEGYKHIPSGGSSGQFLGYNAAGTATWVDNPNTHYTANIYTLGSSGTTVLNTNTDDPYIGLVENSNRNSAVQIKGGTNIDVTGNNGVITVTNTYTYTLTAATENDLGGIKIGYSESGTNYAVQLSNNQAYVSVPWTDTKVTQTATDTSSTYNKEYPILFKYTDTKNANDTNYVRFASNSSTKKITINPYNGSITAAEFVGDGANIKGITTNHISANSGNTGTKYLRQSGWKTLSIDNTSKAYAVTAVSLTGGTAGTATQASVSNGILTITVGTNTSFQTLNVTDNGTQFLTAATLTESD